MIAALETAVRGLAAWYWSRTPAWLRVVLPLAWAGLIWYLSSRPSVPQPYDPFSSHVWNLGHVVAFGVLCAFVFLSTQGFTARKAVFASLGAAAYGVVDEWHQDSVVGRAVDVWDIGSDTFGAILAASLLIWCGRGDRRAALLFGLCVPLAATTVHMAS